MEYHVIWTVDIEADSPEEAAKQALEIQRDNSEQNLATVFTVTDKYCTSVINVDLNTGHYFDNSDHCSKCGAEEFTERAYATCDESFIAKKY